MIEKIAKNTVKLMIAEQMIKEKQQEIYQYALVMYLEKAITVLSLLFIGYVEKILLPAILFMLFFFSLRKRTGGYHAKRFINCYILTILTFCIMAKYFMFLLQYSVIVYCVTIISVILIFVIGTVNHPNMHMSENELSESKKAARCLVILEGMCIALFEFVYINPIYSGYMSCAVIMCAFLLCLAKLLRQEV